MATSKDKKTTGEVKPTASSGTKEATVTQTTKNSGKAAVDITASTLPSAEELKERFKAGSIPLQTDFADLIDMAEIGAKAAGKASEQSKAGIGMRISSGGQLEPDVTSYNFASDPQGYYPLKVNTATNELVVDIYNGLTNTLSGLSVMAGNGITVDKDGVSVDFKTVLPAGIITMFSGSAVPVGWALCDGNNDTPDLRDRFIMGGTIDSINGKSLMAFGGEKDNKSMSFTSASQTVNISGQTEGHSLTAAENGEHSHYAGIAVEHTSKCLHGYKTITGQVDWLNAGSSATNSGKYEPVTQQDGSGTPHSHKVSITSGAHTHDNNVTIPYYILAFIIKL